MPAPFVENAVFFSLDGFSFLVEDEVTIGVWVHFWVFNSIPLVYLSVSIPVQCSFYYNCSLVKRLVRNGDSTRDSFILEKSFCYPRFFVFPDEFGDCSFKVCKRLCGNFKGNCSKLLEAQHAFSKMLIPDSLEPR